jgi:dephospho-CoA kinase
MTKIIGITGGIGSGKTTLSKYVKKRGFLVHESDKVVSEMYTSPSKSFIGFIEKNISRVVLKKNKINKKKITNIIFNNIKAKHKLEKYIHTHVQSSRKKFIQKNTKKKNNIIFADIPLLLENKLEKNFDLIICIMSSRKNRAQRVLKNKKFTKKILNKIFSIQTSDKERRKRSQIIINNNKTKKEFIFKIEKVLTKILK